MNYDNKEKLSQVLTQIINSENQAIVEKNKELEEWKKSNLPKIRELEKLEKTLLLRDLHIKMLVENIEVFMKWIWAELVDESWVDWCGETWESWGEEIVLWRYLDKELSLTHNQKIENETKKEEIVDESVPF